MIFNPIMVTAGGVLVTVWLYAFVSALREPSLDAPARRSWLMVMSVAWVVGPILYLLRVKFRTDA